MKLTWEMTKLSILSAMEYRLSFILQVFGMILNDLGLLVVWIIFFNRFTAVNGWTMHDMVLLFAVFLLIFGLFASFFGGMFELAKYIARGELDYFLALPKNVLWHSSTSRTEIPAMADLILGSALFIFFTGHLSFERVITYFSVAILGTLIIVNFGIITQSLAFYIGNYEESGERWFWILFTIGLYPQTAFTGALKLITLTIIPIFFVVEMPVNLLKEFHWELFAGMLGFWLVTFMIGLWMFNRGLRRYESGNLINVRL